MLKNTQHSDCNECSSICAYFKNLKTDELAELNRNRFEVFYKAGETIIKQGSLSKYLVSFSSGYAKVFIEGPADKNLIISIVQPKQILGGPGIYTDSKHHYSVVALTDTKVCLIELDTFKDFVRRNPEFAEGLIADMNSKAIDIQTKFMSLTQKQMHGRIADGLLYLSEDIFKAMEFDMLINRQELAELTGMSKESACRILKDFKDSDVIDFQNSHMKILNMEALQKISRNG